MRVRMNTAAAFQLRDLKGQPAGFASASKGDELDMDDTEAAKFVKAGYASKVEANRAK